MIIVLLGVAGAGKSLQAQLLSGELGWKWLSSGNYLRQTLDAQTAKKMVKGTLLPDESILPTIENYINKLGKKESCFLDGFPRNTSQAEWLIDWNKKAVSQKVKAVIHLVASKQTAKQRLIERARPDDHETAIQKRFEEYDRQILPIIGLFKEQTDIPIFDINAEGQVKEVSAAIRQKILLVS